MRLSFDEYIHLNSPLHRWDPRLKLIGIFSLMFAFAFVRDPRLLLAMVAVTAAIFIASHLPFTYLISRLRYPSLFLLALVIALPFISGDTTIASAGPFDIKQEGLTSSIMIASRFFCIITLGLVLFSTAPFLTTIKSMRALGLSETITDMALLAFRYFHDIGEQLHNMENSMLLRGFRPRRLSPRSVSVLAWLGGSILVRSYERSEWVYKAMILRGYGQAAGKSGDFKARTADAAGLIAVLMISASFIAAQAML